MTKQNAGLSVARTMVLGVVLLAASGVDALAQDVKLIPRCLTAAEAKLCPTGTRSSPGNPNVGIGEPLYLDVLAATNRVVTNVMWSLMYKPAGSTATLQTSPVTNTLNSYDTGDVRAYFVVGRKMLIPDVGISFSDPGYKVCVTVQTTIATYVVTNEFFAGNYIGVDPAAGNCDSCHDVDKVATFMTTKHATAFQRKINGSDGAGFKQTCASCHVVGYDTNALAVNGGFDDVQTQTAWPWPTNLADLAKATNNWANMPAALRKVSNILCESCHGQASSHFTSLGETNRIGITLSAGNCGRCHDSPTHHIKNFQWAQTLHATGYVVRATGSCAPCHSARGFIDKYDPDYAGDATLPMPRGLATEGVSCALCHDPHSPGMGDYQLRPFSNVVLATGYTNTVGGIGLLCMQCHKDRYNAESSVAANSRQTPHYGVQGDMLLGKNAIEYGMRMPSSKHSTVIEASCVECHMQETPTNGVEVIAKNKVGAHTFSLSWTDGTNVVDLTENCSKCHGEIEDFNFGGEDYDRDGYVEGVQSEMSGLLDTIARMLPGYPNNRNPDTLKLTNAAAGWTLSQRKAAWNYLFVWEDRSLGVHNPKYAAAILQASVDDLMGGIDVDRDGLLDTWEIAQFGSLTNQVGSGDADGDGLRNSQEMAIGTNPNVKDSDGDLVWDGAEVAAGANPSSSSSTPGTNSITVLPAMELAFLPSTNGITMSFQAVDSLTGGTWTNIGPSFVSTNAWFYQLINSRGPSGRYFRVAGPVP